MTEEREHSPTLAKEWRSLLLGVCSLLSLSLPSLGVSLRGRASSLTHSSAMQPWSHIFLLVHWPPDRGTQISLTSHIKHSSYHLFSFFSCKIFYSQRIIQNLISHRSEDSSYVVPCVLNQRDVCVSARVKDFAHEETTLRVWTWPVGVLLVLWYILAYVTDTLPFLSSLVCSWNKEQDGVLVFTYRWN